jgi:hypothetical protein
VQRSAPKLPLEQHAPRDCEESNPVESAADREDAIGEPPRQEQTATQVQIVMRSATPLNSAYATHRLRTQKMNVWMILIWNIVTLNGTVQSLGLPNANDNPLAFSCSL